MSEFKNEAARFGHHLYLDFLMYWYNKKDAIQTWLYFSIELIILKAEKNSYIQRGAFW